MDARKVAAEFVGTFFFIGIGLLAVQSIGALGATDAPKLVVVPFGFGLGLMVSIVAFGHISGGHFNPAVTIGMVLDGRTTPVNGVGYVVAQILGASLSALLVLILFDQAAVRSTVTAPGAGFDDIKALVLEGVLTAVFVLVILAATKHQPNLAALAIPLTLVVIHLAAVPFTGSSVNPARSIGPAVIGGDLNSLWVYIVGPSVGGILGWAIWAAFKSPLED